MTTKEKLIIFGIVIVAAVLRFWRLGENPPSLYWDEVSLGYNAYSILKTGRDEHGEFFPLTRFIAFGDYKPPAYIYATVPSIAIFGATEFAVRLPSALAGTLTVLLTYFLVVELFGKKPSTLYPQPSTLGLIAAFLLAISPWHLQFSRGAFEANLATFFSAAGIYFFLKGMEKGKLLLLSSTFFVLAMYTFNTHRVFVPLFAIGLMLIKRKQLFSQLRSLVGAALLGTTLLIPLIPYFLSREGQLRFQEVSFFRDLNPIILANERIQREGNTLFARIIHNRRIQFTTEFFKHYADHFNPSFLFFSGDMNPRLGTRDNGLLYPIELPLLIAGIYFLVKRKPIQAFFLLFWWAIGIIPAATARETPHALRTLNILPAPQMIAAFGVISLYERFVRRKFFLSLLIISYSLLIVSYLHTYFIHYPQRWSASWQYGYKEVTGRIRQREAEFDRIFVTTKYGRPYIYFLFYNQYPPEKFWETSDAQRDWFGFWTVAGFGKYSFTDAPAKPPENKEKWLLITGPDGLPKGAQKIETVNFLNDDPAFEIGEM